ncbi:MAG: hypothetical protein HY799_11940 [Nitrosomonadales bacterium]|nr:hypothetical protein [Nitrosomonadales bacterium]
MKAFSIRKFESPCRDKEAALIISVYLFRSDVPPNHLDSALTEILAKGGQFDAVHFVGMDRCISLAKTWMASETSIRARLEKVLPNLDSDVCFISFNKETGRHCVDSIGGELIDAEDILRLHQKYCLRELFEAGNGLTRASNEYHYVKPSKKHAGAFLRTSAVLEMNGATNIISFWMLPLIWKQDIRYIVVDTTGIASIGLALSCNALLHGGIDSPPLVLSHESYGGLEHLSVKNPEETLLLISATTSGNLRQELIELGAVDKNIHTLFFLGENRGKAGNVLCDLTKSTSKDKTGLEPIKNFDQNRCPYCAHKSYPIVLVGDQFSPEPAKVDEIEINRPDLPLAQQAVIDKLAGTGLFKVNKNVAGRNLEYFLDTSVLFASDSSNEGAAAQQEVQGRWKGMVTRGAPVTLNRIVHAEYPFSKELAESSRGILSAYRTVEPSLITNSRDMRASSVTADMSTLVVASCIDDSQELMGVNRDLRSLQPRGNTTYISPIFRAASNKERERIRANLTFGENGKATFSLHSIYVIDLPEETGRHSWLQEIDFLNELLDWIDSEGRVRPLEFVARLERLYDAPKAGMSEKLFWPSHAGKELEIRPDFTLLKVDGKRKLSQADIYAVVSAVLHSLRKGVDGKPKLEYRTYARAVLSPDNFQRLNDGVIQASILRAARQYELSYASCDIGVSRRMKDLLADYANKSREGEGEALMEFLIALASSRLTLHAEHEIEVADAVLMNSGLPNCYHELARFIKNRKSD